MKRWLKATFIRKPRLGMGEVMTETEFREEQRERGETQRREREVPSASLESQWDGLTPYRRQLLIGAKSLMCWKSWDALTADERALLTSLKDGN